MCLGRQCREALVAPGTMHRVYSARLAAGTYL